MAFLVDTVNNYLNGIYTTAMAGAGGVAGDVASGVGNSINGVGRGVESSIRYYGDGARDYGNYIKDYTGASGAREATGNNPLGLTGSTNNKSWSNGGGSSISKTLARADAVTKSSGGSARKALPPARERAKPKALPAPAPKKSPTKTITVGGVTKKMPVYKDGERVGGSSAAPSTATSSANTPARKGPTKQSIARKERNRNARANK